MISSIGNLIGGLGMLLIGMSLMTDGLKLAAGNTLRDILALWTNTRVRGLFSGFLITGIVQSSSAVTVATIGFANAGMLPLERAIWVIFGSNVGTTMTAWIVALIGFKLNIEVLAMPLIGIGAILKLTGAQSKRSSLGLAVIGFGLLFLGIGFLKDAFESISGNFTLPGTESLSLLTVIAYVGAGFMMTTLVQSSSAAMVVALSAAESGVLPFNIAAAVVIGANLGTTTTAIISVFGATSTAKRVAVSHVSFNVITAIVAVLVLVPMLWFGQTIQSLLGFEHSPSVSLAIFHTTFNVLGVLLMWPISSWMVRVLNRFFQTEEETESRPKYLDKNVLALPYIAVDALTLEIGRISVLTVQLMQMSLRSEHTGGHQNKAMIVRNLAREVGGYSAKLGRTELTPFLSEAVHSLITSTQEFLMTVDIAEDIALLSVHIRHHNDGKFREQINNFIDAADAHLTAMLPGNSADGINSPRSYEHVDETYRSLKAAILHEASSGTLEIADMDSLLQYANQVKRGCRHLWKAARRLATVRESVQRTPEGEVFPSSAPDQSNIEKLQDAAKSLDTEPGTEVGENG